MNLIMNSSLKRRRSGFGKTDDVDKNYFGEFFLEFAFKQVDISFADSALVPI